MQNNKSIKEYLKKDRWKILFIIILSILSSSFTIFSPRILGHATNELVEYKSSHINNILFLILIAGILYILSFIVNVIETQCMNKINQNLVFSIRRDIQDKINRLPVGYFERNNDGELLSKIINDVELIGTGLDTVVTQAISSIITIIGIIVIMVHLNLIMALVVLSTIPLSVVFLSIVLKNMQEYFKKQQEGMAYVNSCIEEYYSGIEVIKTSNAEKKSIDNFKNINSDYYKYTKRASFMSSLVNPISISIIMLGYIGVIIFGSFFAIKGIIKIGDILTYMNYVNNISTPFKQIGTVTSSFKQMQVSIKRVFDFLNEKEDIGIENVSDEKIVDIKSVDFDNVRFGYDESHIIIKDFNLHVDKGSTVAIVGGTGSGKTTLIKLLLRFYDVNSGNIRISDIDIKNMQKKELRNHFATVLQENWLFNGSILDNIRFGNVNATLEEVKNAAKFAHADSFINILPNGYDFVVSEDATNLSEGQKQLISIARAFLSDKDILILDEATSSVDTRTELYIKKAMDELMKNKTSFVIAHRLSTIHNADMILVLKDGNIVEMGNHKELIDKKGEYYNLYTTQFSEE